MASGEARNIFAIMPKARLPVDTFVAALFRFSESARGESGVRKSAPVTIVNRRCCCFRFCEEEGWWLPDFRETVDFEAVTSGSERREGIAVGQNAPAVE